MKSLYQTVVLFSLIVAGFVLPHVLQFFGEEYFIGLASRMLIYGIAATSLNFILGYGGMVSFGHAAFLGVGAYVAAILTVSGWSHALVIWPLAMLVSALLALLIGGIVLRTKGVYFIMITLAFAQMLYFITLSLRAYGGDEGMNTPRAYFPGLNLADDTHLYYLVFVLACVSVYLLHRVVESRFGRALVAISENESRMQALGYKTTLLKLVAFVIAGAVAGLAGALLATQNSFVSPAIMHWTSSGLLLFMVILGGIKNKLGGLIGAIVFFGLEDFAVNVHIEWLANFYPNYAQHSLLLVGVVLLAIVLVAPRGICGLFATGGRRVRG